MKLRYLSLVPLLLLSGCTNDKAFASGKVYQNVIYEYSFDKHCFLVDLENKKIEVPPYNYYEISVYQWNLTPEQALINNEFYVSTKELFVYIHLK